MVAPPSEQSFAGTVAAPGLALGLIRVRVSVDAVGAAPQRPPAEERRALEAAVAAAHARLSELVAVSGPMAGEILAVQVTLLEGPEVMAPALAAIAGGEPALVAWRAALNEQITGYRESDNVYFRARATDMADLRDRVADALADTAAMVPSPQADAILVVEDLPPSRFLETDWSCYRGAVLTRGSAASHVAMLARARGIPLLIGLDVDPTALTDGASAILDAEGGCLIQHPSAATLDRYRQRLARLHADVAVDSAFLDRPAVTTDGTRVQVYLNVDDPAILEAIDPAGCDGIGLTRSEFLFFGADGLPDEETQVRAYIRLLAWAGGKPVTVRTLDAGGDKPIAGLTPEREANPFLGQRGVRLSLSRPDVFRVQLRALARAAARGPLKVMLPMLTVPAELVRARTLFQEVASDLSAEGLEARLPPLGMMVEVPAAALAITTFDADFYSIGSNDLVQYITAASRDNAAVADLYDPLNPAVIELIRRVAKHGAATGREVSLCGDMAADPKFLMSVLGTGVRILSVAPATLARTKAAIAKCTLAAGMMAQSKDELITVYKKVLQSYIDLRPPGIRLKIAEAIGKHKSFVSQITNPGYPVPVPARHIGAIMDACHFSPEEREAFLAAYRRAHPNQSRTQRPVVRERAGHHTMHIEVPPFDDPERQREVEETIHHFARRVIALARSGGE